MNLLPHRNAETRGLLAAFGLAGFTGLMAAVPAATSHAQIVIEVGAQEQQAASDGQTFDPPTTRAWGWAHAALDDAGSLFGTGPAPCATIVCPPGPTVPEGEAGAIARADAGAMNLGVRAWGYGGNFGTLGQAEVEVADQLFATAFTSLSMDIRLDLQLSVNADPDAVGSYRFAVRLGGGDSSSVPFAFFAERRYTSTNVLVTTAQVLLDDGATVIDLADIPPTFEMSLPLMLAPGGTAILISAAASADGPAGGSFANVNAYDSAWLGLRGDFTSLNGYAYPGYAPVPEPAGAALMLLGLAGLLAARRTGVAGPR